MNVAPVWVRLPLFPAAFLAVPIAASYIFWWLPDRRFVDAPKRHRGQKAKIHATPS